MVAYDQVEFVKQLSDSGREQYELRKRTENAVGSVERAVSFPGFHLIGANFWSKTESCLVRDEIWSFGGSLLFTKIRRRTQKSRHRGRLWSIRKRASTIRVKF